ncbi:MAG: DUF1254 domain-containing protein [Thermomicrobiales bacterium]
MTSTPATPETASGIGAQEAADIAVDAYTYLYPLVTMDVTRRQATNVAPNVAPMRGPMNMFLNVPTFPTADFKDVVRPNFDTLYSSAWVDLTHEPVVVSAPDTAGRFYLLPMLDMWTDVFAAPGKRTTGTGAGHFALVPPGWTEELPEGVERIDAPTPYVWIIGRTQTNGPADYDAVHAVQAGYVLTPLSQWGKAPQPVPAVVVDPTVDMKTPPLEQVNAMAGADFFRYAAELMTLHPPHITDQPIVARMKRLGITAGEPFAPTTADAVVQTALAQAPAQGLQAMNAKLPTLARVVNGWSLNTDTMGVYGTYYLKRAIVAMAGLGANLPEDAIYPLNLGDAEGQPLTGANAYTLHFAADAVPPVDAFWSLTLYDNAGFQVANALDRFAIGDRSGLSFNPDGSLDLFIQHDNPGAEKEENWLPAPDGPFNLTMRLYAPKKAALTGEWAPPPVTRVSS